MTDLEKEAREAADRRNRDNRHATSAETPRGAYMSGYLAAATLRDKEIEALLARVAELERMVPRWVLENESALLNEQGWSVSETDKLGNGPRLWLMVPSIPLPEGEG